MLPDKLAARLEDMPGVRPVSMLLAAAKLSRLDAPIGRGMFGEPNPKAMLVNISNPVGYGDGSVGVADFEDDLEDVGSTGMFSWGVSNL